MRNPVKILHIDSDYQVHYLIVREGSFIHSTLSLDTAIAFLKSMEFDLILSEPQNMAILKKAKEGDFSQDRAFYPLAASNGLYPVPNLS